MSLAKKFDGRAFAAQKLANIRQQVLQHQENLTLQSIFPYEDDASVMYTKLKKKDAERVGMRYVTLPLSLKAPRSEWLAAIQKANHNPHIHGLLVQKPSSQQFQTVTGRSQADFDKWWGSVSESILPEKDVDCLGPQQLYALEHQGDLVVAHQRLAADNLDQHVLPATAQAVIDMLLEIVGGVEALRQERVAIIGRSVIVGKPAAYGLNILGVSNELLSSKDDLSQRLPEFSVVVSATGKANLIQAEWIQNQAILVDVGAPVPEFVEACYEKSRAWTPVPYGVGPVTRACLFENCLKLATKA